MRRALATIKEEWQGCRKCGLAEIRGHHDIVLSGSGPEHADYLLVYDAPSADDTYFQRCLAGPAGDLFTSVFREAGIDSMDELFRTPLVGCRPYVVVPATQNEKAKTQNRPPTKEEIAECLPRVQQLIYSVDPYVIFTAGEHSWRALAADRKENTLSKAVGNLTTALIPGVTRDVVYPLMPLLSVEQLIANPSAAEHGPITQVMRWARRARSYTEQLKKV